MKADLSLSMVLNVFYLFNDKNLNEISYEFNPEMIISGLLEMRIRELGIWIAFAFGKGFNLKRSGRKALSIEIVIGISSRRVATDDLTRVLQR